MYNLNLYTKTADIYLECKTAMNLLTTVANFHIIEFDSPQEAEGNMRAIRSTFEGEISILEHLYPQQGIYFVIEDGSKIIHFTRHQNTISSLVIVTATIIARLINQNKA